MGWWWAQNGRDGGVSFVSREEEEGFLERKLDDITMGGVGRCGGIQDSMYIYVYSDDRV